MTDFARNTKKYVDGTNLKRPCFCFIFIFFTFTVINLLIPNLPDNLQVWLFWRLQNNTFKLERFVGSRK